LPENLFEKILEVNLFEQPDSILSEKIAVVVFKETFSKQLAVQAIQKFKSDFKNIIYR
jgi:hypothetical protein